MKIAHALALAAALAGEAVLFFAVTGHHYAWIYPRWYDQLQYLQQAYDAYEDSLRSGFLRAAWHTLTLDTAQGSLHGLLALPVFAALGPSRGAALAVNLLAFLALQVATFLAARRLSGSFAVAWAAVALLAAVRFPWSGAPASAIDFRLDWMGACAYGVALAAALAGNGFRSTRWAVAFGAAAAGVILIRYLTAVYFALIFPVLFLWLLTRPDPKARCARLALSAAVAAGVSAPFLWHNRRAIVDYYWVSQLASPEHVLRGSRLGAVDSIGWLLRETLLYQIGLGAALLGVGAAAALLLSGLAAGRGRAAPAEPVPSKATSWALALAFLGAPAVVLAVHPIKDAQHLCILIPGAAWVAILLWVRLGRGATRAAAATVGAAAVLIGAVLFVRAETGRTNSPEKAAEFRSINALDDYLFFRAEEAGLEEPRVAVTWLLDGLNAKAIGVVGYERHGRRLPFVQTLPGGLFAPEKRDVMGSLADSDFVCLVTRGAAAFPFDRSMEGLLGDMRRWCEKSLAHVGDLDTADFAASVYERPNLARPLGGGGVTLSGLMKAAASVPDYAPAVPPGAPEFPYPMSVVASTRADFRYALAAAYSPVRFAVGALPEGLRFYPGSGEIRGRFSRPGMFPAEITATNPAGSATGILVFHVEDEPWFAVIGAPKSCAVGAPVEVGFGAFDASGKLDYIDVMDMTAGKLLERIDVSPTQRQRRQGSCRLHFDRAGPRTILLRFVRYDRKARENYSFIDRQLEIDVEP